jgi:hypothetical protein
MEGRRAVARCMSATATTAEERADDGGRDYEFWRAHEGVMLVWSNRNASDDVMISNALLNPGFHLLLDIAVRFGFSHLAGLWDRLRADIMKNGYPEEIERLARATPTVERCLKHMREGMASK